MTTTAQHLPPPGSRILVVGLGMTGLSCARFLVRQGYEVAITDSRAAPPALDELHRDLPDIAVFVGGFDEVAFQNAECLVVSPGVSIKHPLIAEARARAIPVVGDIEIFALYAAAPVIAITGSNGKSTVTTLVGEMARQAGCEVRVGGNIGTPALDLLDDAAQLYVLELSSFQLETTSNLHTRAAVILNISEDHMDRYDSLQEYSFAKARIYHHSDVVVVNADDDKVTALVKGLAASRTIVHFGLKPPGKNDFGIVQHQGQPWLALGAEPLLAVAEVRISGWHNIANALAALALGQAAGLDMAAMLTTLKTFAGLEHRTQWLAECHGVQWFNDSKATNVGACIAALEGLMADKVVLIAGGQGKGQDFSLLRQAIADRARCLILLGEDADTLASSLAGLVDIYRVDDMRAAVQRAREYAQPGDAVLLSPACASFDMFNGFAHRGEVFSQCVREVCQ
ncbi:MAG: UDP-N-acetylmuramoyl-L-alanine--D-glutamate ligase [Gammaproteobacteria bacterium]